MIISINLLIKFLNTVQIEKLNYGSFLNYGRTKIYKHKILQKIWKDENKSDNMKHYYQNIIR